MIYSKTITTDEVSFTEYRGLHSDKKPVNANIGDMFLEVDTGASWRMTEGGWVYNAYYEAGEGGGGGSAKRKDADLEDAIGNGYYYSYSSDGASYDISAPKEGEMLRAEFVVKNKDEITLNAPEGYLIGLNGEDFGSSISTELALWNIYKFTIELLDDTRINVTVDETEFEEPLRFTALEDGSTFGIVAFGSASPHISYSLDMGTWTELVPGDTTVTLNNGETAYLKGNGEPVSTSLADYTNFVMSGKIAAHGPISGIAPMGQACYYRMFTGCTSLVNAPELPATTLAADCYQSMFTSCTSLVNAPELPATTLAVNCYQYMFAECASLVNAPELPATTLASSCYEWMFGACTSLVNAPELPATTLAVNCYCSMLYGCASLVNAPELPATTLAATCYTSMFNNCTSLVNAPELPATTLPERCYEMMFYRCTNIKLSATQTGDYQVPYRIPTMGTGTVGPFSLDDMFAYTGGTFKGTPAINTTYYMAVPASN